MGSYIVFSFISLLVLSFADWGWDGVVSGKHPAKLLIMSTAWPMTCLGVLVVMLVVIVEWLFSEWHMDEK